MDLAVQTLYMMVTEDEYELPIAVADTRVELAEMVHIKKMAVYNGVERFRKGAKSKYVEVKVDE